MKKSCFAYFFQSIRFCFGVFLSKKTGVFCEWYLFVCQASEFLYRGVRG